MDGAYGNDGNDTDGGIVVGTPYGGNHLLLNDIPGARYAIAAGNYVFNIRSDASGTWETIAYVDGGFNSSKKQLLVNGYVVVDSDTAGLQLGDDQDVLISSNANGVINIASASPTTTDITLNFGIGATNAGQYLWMEDEDYFKFSDDALMNSTEKIYFRDTAIGIYSQADSYMDIFADGALRIGNSSAGAPTTYLSIEPDGDTFWVGDGSGVPYGSFYGNEIAWSSGALTAPQYKRIADTDCSPGELNLVTYTDDGTTLTVSKAGRYLINWSISAESGTANTHLLAGIMINSTTTLQAAGRNHVETPSANRQVALSGTAILDLAANDVIGVGIGSDVDNITITVDHVNLTVVMVGGT
jgi:hypothetical protein